MNELDFKKVNSERFVETRILIVILLKVTPELCPGTCGCKYKYFLAHSTF